MPVLPPVDARRIGFFLGAGASIEFGIPSMKRMTTSFARKIRNNAGRNKEERKIFERVYTALGKAYGEQDKVDLEGIFPSLLV